MTSAAESSQDDEAIAPGVIEEVCVRLAENKRIRQPLPGGGMLHMDRLLPFLCVYRRNPTRRDEGTAKLVMSEASYLCAPGAVARTARLETAGATDRGNGNRAAGILPRLGAVVRRGSYAS